MISVLLVGAGQLGSRYLQGLSAIDVPLAIKVVDPSEFSLKVAKERFAQMPLASEHSVQFSKSLDDVPHCLDLALVVTPAHCRAGLVQEIAKDYQVNAWILEKLLAQSTEQLDQIEHALAGNKQVWVNTPRRLMAWHQALYAEILPNSPTPLKVRVSGGSWGLACNAIHFIDLLAWWSQASVYSVSASGLRDWVQSKRSGFHEVFGKLHVSYEDGSELELCCFSDYQPTQIFVTTPQGEWIIEETSGRATGPLGQQLQGQISFQSALTAPLVQEILQVGRCSLPSLAESITQHRPLLDALLMHWNQTQSCQDSLVSIT